MVAILVLLTIILFLTLDHVAQQRAVRSAKAALAPSLALPARGDGPDLVDVPAGLFWSPSHTWAHVEATGAVRVGTGRLPLVVLGGVERVEGPVSGRELRAGEPFATLVRGARSIRLRAPVSGTIEVTNPIVDDAPTTLEDDPFGQGWLCSIRPKELSTALRGLRVAGEAREWMRSELRRLRDYLTLQRLRDPGCSVVALADGGVPAPGFADTLGPREWDELVERFFGAPAGPSAGEETRE